MRAWSSLAIPSSRVYSMTDSMSGETSRVVDVVPRYKVPSCMYARQAMEVESSSWPGVRVSGG